MSIVSGSKINQLLANTDPSGLFFSQWLKTKGYSDQLQKRYRDSGWLTPLSQGVMFRTGSRLSAYSALASCNLQTGSKYRIAAHSALEYTGFNHYVPMGKPVLTIAGSTQRRPSWMKDDMFDMTFRIFHTEVFTHTEVIETQTSSGVLYISSPEQAFLECLLLAPKFYDYMDLFYIMEQLTTLRSDVVQRLLETMQNVSVKRMFLYMAEKAGHYWVEELSLDKVNLGTSKIQLVPDGVYNSKYKITVPKALDSYEG
ncbi:MAG: type IV toxin-antitoxin system AbiEi family antitoxin [Roseburia sp.]|nr:type IV toxin-antitoxin system AbiEi family antitoxin [Roseburia sp.]MCM1421118.1 type IV toxin-antitoxin system AbiEi family antitoxin [Bacteroides sp.]